jgi:hypothetical protein
VLTTFQTVHAEHTFTEADLVGWLAGPLTIGVTDLALAAFIPTSSYSPERKRPKDTKKGAQRTYESTVKARNLEVQEDRCEKNGTDQQATLIVALAR